MQNAGLKAVSRTKKCHRDTLNHRLHVFAAAPTTRRAEVKGRGGAHVEILRPHIQHQ